MAVQENLKKHYNQVRFLKSNLIGQHSLIAIYYSAQGEVVKMKFYNPITGEIVL